MLFLEAYYITQHNSNPTKSNKNNIPKLGQTNNPKQQYLNIMLLTSKF